MNPKQIISILFLWFRYTIAYSFYIISGTMFVASIAPLILLLNLFPASRDRALCWLLHGYLSFLTLFFLPCIVRIYSIKKITGVEFIPEKTPCMYVANHQGLLDALLLLGILRNTVALIKTKHASKHIYAKLVKYMHFLAVEAGSREQIGQAFIKAGVVLGQNQSILVFPEGTRSSGKRLLPFKEFAFKIAQHHQIPIVPIVIQMTSPILSKKLSTIFPTKKILYTIRFLKPVFPELSIPSTDLAAETRKIMTKELEAISEKNNEGKQP